LGRGDKRGGEGRRGIGKGEERIIEGRSEERGRRYGE